MSDSETGGSERYEGWSDEQVVEELKASLNRAENCLHPSVEENPKNSIREARRLVGEIESRSLHTDNDWEADE